MKSSSRAQATLELAVAMVCVWLLVFGIFRVFFWLNQRLVYRQEDYEGTGGTAKYGRVAAGKSRGSSVDLRENSQTGANRYGELSLDLLK
jgi:hypothetical protein